MTEFTEEMWQKVEDYMPWNLSETFFNLSVSPHWFADGQHFWYRQNSQQGLAYLIVNAETGIKTPAFDAQALLAAIAVLPAEYRLQTTPEELFEGLEILSFNECSLELNIGRHIYSFDGKALHHLSAAVSQAYETLSPDGTKIVFRRDCNLWLRDVASGQETALTTSGAPHFEWAKSPDQSLETIFLQRRNIVLPPIVVWSPDSSRIFTYQLDERNVRVMPLVQNVPDDGSHRPVKHELRIAFTGDEILPMAYQAVIDVATATMTRDIGAPVHVSETSGIEKCEAWWSADSGRVFFLSHDRYEQHIGLFELDAESGQRRHILTENAQSFVDVNMQFGSMPNIHILDETNELIWFSQRDGWAHLYLCDLTTGAIKAQITKGQWVVRDLLHIQKDRRQVYFIAGGLQADDHGGYKDQNSGTHNPYLRTICVASFDGGDVKVLTREQGDHDAVLRYVGWSDILERSTSMIAPASAFSPDGRYFVSGHGDFDHLTETVLRRNDGEIIAVLDRGETSKADALVWPQSFQTLAADGETAIYGALWLPDDYHADGRYPVLDMTYPGPQCTKVPHRAFPGNDAYAFFHNALAGAFTKLGIAVVMIDGRGTPFRSKAYHDLCHGNLADPGFLSDHVAALQQLFERFSGLDPNSIGIMGHSAGGHAAARAVLAYPDFYKVAVATAGSHDPRTYNCCWPEKWQGKLVINDDGSSNYDTAANHSLAAQLKGKLLLGHGDMDENVHPAMTQQLAAALIREGKVFDTLITPNDDHYSYSRSPYVTRRRMEYLLRHL